MAAGDTNNPISSLNKNDFDEKLLSFQNQLKTNCNAVNYDEAEQYLYKMADYNYSDLGISIFASMIADCIIPIPNGEQSLRIAEYGIEHADNQYILNILYAIATLKSYYIGDSKKLTKYISKINPDNKEALVNFYEPLWLAMVSQAESSDNPEENFFTIYDKIE